MKRLYKQLNDFAKEQKINTKGPLCVVLVVTRSARTMEPPFADDDFLTPKGGQVKGLGRSAVQKILADHGISRTLAEEGGRTSRGSMGNMRAYLELLNSFAEKDQLDLEEIEKWWIGRVKNYFSSKPLRIKVDPSKSLRRIIADLLEATFIRQKECPGTMIAGAVMQHLVGAKLEIAAIPDATIEHMGFSVADAPKGRKGDFVIGDTAIHVTTAPTEALIRKCRTNLDENMRPLIITTQDGAAGASALAKEADIADRIDVLELEQFVATNLYEWSGFKHQKRPVSIKELVDTYNRIIDECETDPSLKISMG